MAEIIVKGYKIDTKDIWDISEYNKRGYAGIVISLVNEEQIVIKEYIDNLWNFKQSDAKARYRRLKEELTKKWNEDKSDVPVFKV